MKHFAIAKVDQGNTQYWTNRRICWTADYNDHAGSLLTREQAANELARLNGCGVVGDLMIVDVIVRKLRNEVYSTAFRKAVGQKERTPELMAIATAAGNDALARAGYSV